MLLNIIGIQFLFFGFALQNNVWFREEFISSIDGYFSFVNNVYMSWNLALLINDLISYESFLLEKRHQLFKRVRRVMIKKRKSIEEIQNALLLSRLDLFNYSFIIIFVKYCKFWWFSSSDSGWSRCISYNSKLPKRVSWFHFSHSYKPF